MENNEIYEDAFNLAEVTCNAKDKIRSLLACGEIETADKVRLSVMTLGHYGRLDYRRLEGCILELFNELTYGMIMEARAKKKQEELKND